MPGVLKYRSALCVRIFEFIAQEEFCDVEIKAKTQTFQCHRVILAAASPLLRRVIKNELAELGIDGKLVLNMEYLSSEVMEGLLQFIYTGDCIKHVEQDPEFGLAVELFLDPKRSSLSIEEIGCFITETLKSKNDADSGGDDNVQEPAIEECANLNETTSTDIEKDNTKTSLHADGASSDEKGPFYIIQVDEPGQFSFLSPQHKSRVHLPRKPPFLCPCQNCGKIFETFERLRSHYRHNHGEKKFKCSQCPLRFLYPKDLKCHMRTHTGEKPFICEICGRAFAQFCSLGIHLKVHEKAEKTRVIIYPCSDCKKRYCCKENPLSNLDLKNFDLTSLRCPNNFCAKKFTSIKTIRKHIMNDVCNPGKSYCTECCTRFDSPLLLKQHVGKEHCTHKRKQRRVRVDPGAEVGNIDATETTVIEFGNSVIETTDQGGELGFEQVDNILELCGEVEMDAEETIV